MRIRTNSNGRRYKVLNEEIIAFKERFVQKLNPLKIYLFGSYAYGNPESDSDYDFYIVVDDSKYNTYEISVKAYGCWNRCGKK